MGIKRFVGLIIVLMLTGVAVAEEAATQKLDEIVVTATKTEKIVEEAPASVTVVTQAEMQRRNISTVDDALAEIPGVFVKRSKGLMDSTSSVRMRGFSGDEYTLILIDGQPLNDAYTGGVEWGALPTDNIERIEVIRGAASALYGGNAMGGVVNIITKTPEKLEMKASAGYGTHNTQRYRGSVGNRFGDKLSLRIGYEQESTDGYVTTPVVRNIGSADGGYPTTDKSGAPRWVVGDKGENGAEKHSIDAKAVYDFSDTGNLSVTAVSGHHEYDYGPPNAYSSDAYYSPNNLINYTGIGDTDTDTYTLAMEKQIGLVEFHFQAGTVKVDDRYTTESGSGNDDYYNSPGNLSITEKESWFSELRASFPMGQSHLLTLGISYRTDESDTNQYTVPFYRSYDNRSASTYYSGGKDRIWSIFVQEEWQAADPLTIYLGGRYDSWEVYDGASGAPGSLTAYNDSSDSAFSPRAAAVWKAATSTTLRASVGNAFRSPTLYELYRSWSSFSTDYISNPDLKPETVWSYELGVDQFFFDKRTKLSLTGYRNDIDDLIYYKTEDIAGRTTKTRINAGQARTYGLEFELSQKMTDWLTLQGGYTYTDAKIIESPTDLDSEDQQVAGIPEHTWDLGLHAEYNRFKASLAAHYFSKIYNDSDNGDTAEGVYTTYEPSFVMDAKVTYTPWKWGELSVCVDNIFDEAYYQYYKTDGRTIFAELTLRY